MSLNSHQKIGTHCEDCTTHTVTFAHTFTVLTIVWIYLLTTIILIIYKAKFQVSILRSVWSELEVDSDYIGRSISNCRTPFDPIFCLWAVFSETKKTLEGFVGDEGEGVRISLSSRQTTYPPSPSFTFTLSHSHPLSLSIDCLKSCQNCRGWGNELAHPVTVLTPPTQ
jgi:hypothetical protein